MAKRLLIGLSLIGMVGCRSAPEHTVIGYAFSISGTPTVQVAREEIAEHAGGPTIEIIYDSVVQGDPADVEVERAERLAAVPDLIAVVGHGGSRGTLAAAPVYNRAQIPQLVPIGTSRFLKHAGPWTFMLATDDSTEGAFIGEFAVNRLGARRVSIFFENDEYGTGLRDGVTAELHGRGVPVGSMVAVDPASDVPTLVEGSLLHGIPDVVISAARWQATGRIAQTMRAHVPGVQIIAGDGAFEMRPLVDTFGTDADSIYIVAFWLPDAPGPESRAFVARFERVTGREAFSADAMSHDALMLLADAIRTVGPSRNAVRRYLLELGSERPAYEGVTGRISFGPHRQPPLIMTQVRDGKARRVLPR